MTLSFDLRREQHAIGEFIATLTFFKAVTPTTFAAVAAKLKSVAIDMNLPAPMSMQVVTFNLDGSTPHPEVTDGAGWQRFSPNGEAALSVFCDRDSIQLSCRDYVSWEDILPVIIRCFSEMAVPFMEEVPAVKSFTIRYVNEFRSKASGFVSASEMLRENNYWVPAFAFEIGEPWHSHVGLFEDVTTDNRRLIHVNVNCALAESPDKQGPFTAITALILVGQQYDVPGASPLMISTESIQSVLKSNFDKAHTREKEVLAELFSDSYLSAMGALSTR